MSVVRMAMRKAALRSLAICVGLCLTGLAVASPVASAEGSSALGGTGGSSLGSPLVTPGSPTEGEQLQMQEEARRSNPEAVAEREASSTEFEGLDTEQAAKVAGEEFPAVIDEPAGGAPKLSAGQSITGYPTDDAAQVDLGEGRRGVIESTAPIALETSSGQRIPVDLRLVDAGNAFEPTTPVVGVRIPKQLGEGVALAGTGVSLTAVDAQGSPLGGSEGVVDGMTVLYANTQTDTDTLIKPTTAGFDASTMLRSVESPQQLYFRIGLPAGASLVQEGGSGAVEVVEEGATIAVIPSPGAKDAVGTSVPVSMSLSGHTLVLSVEHHSGEYQYPIAVDPEVKGEDPQLVETSGGKRSNWKWVGSETKFGHEPNEGPNKDEGPGKGYLETKGIAEYKETEKAYWAYQTKGVSKIWQFDAKTEGKNKGAEIESFLELEHSGASENKYTLSTETKTPEYGLESAPPFCAKNGEKVECSPAAGTAGNVVRFQQSVQKAPSNYKFSDSLHEGIVFISEPSGTHSTTKFNTESKEVEGEVEEGGKKVMQKRPNALYGSGGWLTKYKDAIEPIAEDPGVGVSSTKLEYESSPDKWETISEHNYLTANGCEGVQCYPKHGEYSTLNEKLANGEDKIRYRAEEALGTAEHLTESPENEAASTKTVKVDKSPPHHIFISGLPWGNELSERHYELTVYATDGEGGTVPSSGVKSIALYIDNTLVGINGGKGPTEGTEGKCSVAKGECTGSAKWTINGAELGAGHHTIQVEVFDNAGNEGRLPGGGTEISIRHSTPVALGPGSVDLESGDFSLGASDVSMGSGLTVARAYSSRATEEGAEGPLGPEWSMSLANTESLLELVDGSLLMTAANGSQAIFAKPSAGVKCESGAPFESPVGDSNLKLWCEENKETKQRTAYYLEDAADHSKVKFVLPSGGGKAWVPTKQEGVVATDTVTYTYQTVEVEGKKITRPTEVLAPHPEVSCAPTMEPGCRALKFTYATATTATGENRTEWGEYNGRLSKVSYEGYNLAKGVEKMETKVVAEYSYDKQGRLRAEWDPRISPALKTTYGYDAEGHVTALNPPGQEPWAFTYGTVASDAGTGRLLKAARAPASAGLWGGTLPSNTAEAPKLSGTPKVGVRMGVTKGSWSSQPVAYAFQWEDCNSEGKECTTIAGATNENYRPGASDVGHTLVAQVSATNGGGSVSKATVASSVVKAYEEAEYARVKNGAEIGPESSALGSEGYVWFTIWCEKPGTIGKVSTSGVVTEYSLPSEYGYARGITAGPGKEEAMWFIDKAYSSGRYWIAKTTPSGTITEVHALPEGMQAEHLTAGPDGNLWVPFFKQTGRASYIGKMTPEGKLTEYKLPETDANVGASAITPGPEHEEALWFGTDNTVSRITTSGTVTPYSQSGSHGAPQEMTVGPDGNVWLIDYEGTVGKMTTSGTFTEYHLPEGSDLSGITAGSDGDLWVTESGTSKITKISTSGQVSEYAQPAGSEPRGISAGSDNNVWFTDHGTGKIGKLVLGTGTPTTEYEYSAPPSVDRLPQVAAGPDGNVWVTDWDTSKIWKMATGGKVEGEYSLPHTYESWESAPAGITPGPEKENAMWVTEHDSDKIARVTTAGEISEYKLPLASAPYGIVAGPEKEKALWFTDFNSNKIGRITTSGVIKEYSLLTAESAPVSITLGSDGNLWFAADYTSKIGRITPSGEIKEYALPENSRPLSIVAGPDGNLWFTEEESSKIGKITTSGAITEYPVAKGSYPLTITAGADGNLWFTLPGDDKIGKITTSGEVTEYAEPAETQPYGIAAGPDGNVWFADYDIGKVGKVTLGEGESYAPQSGSTVDYNAPLGGAGVPTMTESRVAQWGQKAEEAPVEATAIFPPDSPQGWPTGSSYNRATIYYLDEQGRGVNVSTPTNSEHGSVSTVEHNEFNDVTRTLTPDNREAALAEGCESESNCASAKKAKLLSTENTYDGEGEKETEVLEPGTQLIVSRGPEHMIKYVAGEEQYEPGEKPKEAMARSLTKYYYNEGAPTENPRTKARETYNLVTKTQNYAELTSENNNEAVDVRTTKTSYSGQEDLGWVLRAPTSVTANPGSLNLTTTTEYYETGEAMGQVKETRGAGAEGTFTYTSKFGEAGSEAGKLSSPFSVAFGSTGDMWVADSSNNRIEEFGAEGKFLSTFGKAGSEPGQLKEPKGIAIDSKGNIWVSESGNNRVQEFSTEGKSLQTCGKAGSEPGELKEPKGIAIDSKGNIWVADLGNNRIAEFSGECKYTGEFGTEGSEVGKIKEPTDVAVNPEGDIWVAERANNRVQEFSSEGKLLDHIGTYGAGAGQMSSPFGVALDASGHLWVTEQSNNRVQEFSSSGAFMTQFGWKGSEAGQLDEPRAAAIDAKGDIWVVDTINNRLEEWSKGPNAHDSKAVFYTSEENKEYSNCGKRPEWAGLVCETLPAKQPELAGLPKLPVTTTTYNMWDEPETIEEAFGPGVEAKKRTMKDEYDAAGRLTSGDDTSTATTETSDKTLPKVTNVYNENLGVLEKQSTTVGETTKTVTSKYNTLGQLETYTDADGNVAKFKYGGPEKDGLLEEMSDGSKKGESNQKYTYSETTKEMTELIDSAAGTFTAAYDTEGKLTSEVYPNGMCANYTYNSVSEATRIEYIKTTNCSESKPSVWYDDERMPSIRGEMMSQTSTLASETYAYDQSGRLTEAQETPTGEGCTIRLYAYDEGSNRTSLTTRTPGSGGKCASEGGTVEAHNYDEAGRLTDNGITYDPLGNVINLPAGDAEGHALESTFYVDNAIATQTQNGVTNDYYLDPDGRVRETVTGSNKVITHYDGSGEAVAWTGQGSGEAEKWTRNIPGLDGSLTAIQEGEGKTGKTPVLQLHDLQGDVVATIKDKTGETELSSKYNSTEFGVPNGGKEPPKYAWLGAGGIERSLSSGVITEGATSYVPQIGRPLQSEAVEPPGAPEGTGVGAPYTDQLEPWVLQGATREANEAPGIGVAEEIAAEEAACRANPASCIEDPYVHYNLTVAGIGEIVKFLTDYLVEFHEKEFAEGIAGAGTGLLSSTAIGLFVSFSHTPVAGWVEFFSYWITALQEDAKRLKNRGPKDAEYLSLSIWSYEFHEAKTGNTYYLPYALEATWCWQNPRQWCSSHSRSHEI